MTGPDLHTDRATPTRDHWQPRVRGGITIIGGTLAYVALAAMFGNPPSFVTALVGMLGSLAAMCWVWFLEARRSARHDAAARSRQR